MASKKAKQLLGSRGLYQGIRDLVKDIYPRWEARQVQMGASMIWFSVKNDDDLYWETKCELLEAKSNRTGIEWQKFRTPEYIEFENAKLKKAAMKKPRHTKKL